MSRVRGRTFWPLVVVVLAACSNGSGSLEDQPAPPAQPAQTGLTIGGTVAGLTGGSVVLQNNAGGDLAVEGDGAFTFAATASTGAGYAVTVLTQPTTPAQTCTVANGTGTVANANISNVVVTCSTAPRYTIGVTVTGLTGTGLVLLNGTDSLPINSNGNYLFSTALTSGTAYAVRVGNQPGGQNCLVRNAEGTIGTANVTNVEVQCASNQFTVGGTVTGLAGTGLVLQLNGANDLAVATGKFTFPMLLPTNTAYAVTVKQGALVTKPAQDCVITGGGTGTIAGANVETVAITCTTKKFPVGGEVSGLVGRGLVLQLNDANDLTIQGNGSFAFPPIASGTQYRVTVKTQPTSPLQECTPANPTGVVDAAAVTTIRITCATKSYAVGGTVIDLAPGTSLVLQNNLADNLTIAANGKFKFATPVASGGAYRVTVLTHPSNPAQTCDVKNGSGTISDRVIDDVVVSCSTRNLTVGGTVNNLVGSGLELRNGPDRVTIDTAGPFAFPRTVPSGSAYSVVVHRNPSKPQQTCAVAGTTGVGTVGDTNVTSVVVDCVTDGFTIGGNVSGLRSSGLVIQNNGADNLAIAADGAFTFPTALPEGSPYGVTVLQQPLDPTNICFVSSPTNAGTVGTSNITNVQVSCF